MTGFGRGSHTTDTWQANVELSSVNRKQAEIVVQGPRELAELENTIRKTVLQTVARGRVQVSIKLERAQGGGSHFRVDAELARSFQAAMEELSAITGNPLSPRASDFLRQPGVISTDESGIDAETAWLAIEPALQEAIAALNAMRSDEGAHLVEDFLARLQTMEKLAERIAADAPARLVRAREAMYKRLADAGLALDLNDERIIKELAIFADRCDVTEELTRLASHIAKFRSYLDSRESVGRSLDFLCQELFREFNTIASKANDATIAQTIVEAKTEVEKIREQVQNLE